MPEQPPPDAARQANQPTPAPGTRTAKWLVLAALAGAAALVYLGRQSGEAAVMLPAPTLDLAPGLPAAPRSAVFAGGCFWGVQAVFQHTRGVLNAVSGYAGGQAHTAHYDRVASGRTGHAESVQVTYDPQQVSYGKLLQIYFSVAHDPTEVNRQGPDVGPQYRSAIFYQDAGQQQVAARYIAELDAARVFARPIATELTPLPAFYPAEAAHQDYATLNPYSLYIVAHDKPKLANLQRLLPEVYRSVPVLVGGQARAAGASAR